MSPGIYVDNCIRRLYLTGGSTPLLVQLATTTLTQIGYEVINKKLIINSGHYETINQKEALKLLLEADALVILDWTSEALLDKQIAERLRLPVMALAEFRKYPLDRETLGKSANYPELKRHVNSSLDKLYAIVEYANKEYLVIG